MLDIQFIRDNPETVKEKSKQKGYEVDIDHLLQLDADRRTRLIQAEELRRRRNELSDKSKNQPPSEEQIAAGRQLKEELGQVESDLKILDEQFETQLRQVPNMPAEDVPVGYSEEENVVAKEWGVKKVFDFTPKSHAELGEAKGFIDKERAAKVAGARFAYIKGDLVLLEFALWHFALNQLTDEQVIHQLIADNNLELSSKPFVPVLPPAVAKTEVYEATGRLNKEEQTYKLADDDLWLNASAEHTMAPMYMNEILDEKDLPLRYVGYTTAFRREAGTYGKDTEGIFRLHQFNKLEMETFGTADSSLHEHFLMIAIQEYLMQQLELPHRVVNKCTADIGGPNARGVDIDVWLPAQAQYRETHTADYITDYQARRMRTRVRRVNGSVELVHTNDATAFAERAIVAIMENYQTANGSIIIPDVLRPYMGGRESI
ncbi:serine--tRNA ligase [soil metagenome]